MYKYTPKKSILRDLNIPKTGRWWDKDYKNKQDILKKYNMEPNYTLVCTLSSYYKDVTFYSKKKVNHVPVKGYLFPVIMFNEEEIND